jgi:hypothetical protein
MSNEFGRSEKKDKTICTEAHDLLKEAKELTAIFAATSRTSKINSGKYRN